MYHVSAQVVDERMRNVHYYYYYPKNKHIVDSISDWLIQQKGRVEFYLYWTTIILPSTHKAWSDSLLRDRASHINGTPAHLPTERMTSQCHFQRKSLDCTPCCWKSTTTLETTPTSHLPGDLCCTTTLQRSISTVV